jgi:acetyl-CoA acetyltransferase
MLTKVYIPYKGYFSSPFSRWQGSMANENSIELAAETAKRWLEEKSWDPKVFDYLFLGITVHQLHGFYGGPWAAALMGAADIPGLLVSQACSTSTIAVGQASIGVETGL